MNEPLLQQLLQKYLTETLSAEELLQLRHLLKDEGSIPLLDREFRELFNEQMKSEYVLAETDLRIQQYVMTRLHETEAIPVQRVHPMRRWWWAAACIVLLLGTGAYLWNRFPGKAPAIVHTQATSNDVLPGKDGAILTLADGRQVVLDSMKNGIIAQQNGARINLQNGQLHYDPMQEVSGMVAYNTMTTPKGRQFQVTLPDGTKVWLNAASSITYPTVFNGKDRLVKIRGEVYFEVAKDQRKPFKVNINDAATVEVLGTHFNVNAYLDETAIKTTLLEGSVKIVQGTAMETLQPGQQAVLGEGIQKNAYVNTEQVMAWKNGVFNFNGLSLAELMRQLSRWYDIEVIYTAGIPTVTLFGEMGRDLNLSQVLQALQQMDVQCRLEDKKLIVTQSKP